MPTKEELKRLAHPPKLKVRTGDKVMIIAGKDRGEIGTVIAVSPKEQRVMVVKENEENPDEPIPLNRVVRHRKARRQGEKSARIVLPGPIHISNVMVIDPSTGQPTRIGRKVVETVKDGKPVKKIVRYAKKSGTVFEDGPTYRKEEK